ncbi:DUF1045 domain-containing protein [Phaeobacter sp.]|uniref:DUF1045 domain-containing protein n=1 Tax=Phaeobacter sp. TaxID=1902409 RepID=UPI0025E5000B|nr:DUF1045 domain-containing protein [Phaeobacter sp.]
MTFSRYAIYYLPPATEPWSQFATQWLGWDIHHGQQIDHPADTGLDISAITRTPRKYGLHATIKPPFRLADGTSVDALADRFAALARSARAVSLDGLALTRMGRFLALCPVGDQSALNKLALQCVRDLDEFRAPPPEAELERRRQGGLSAVQEQALMTWGYPYVGDSFRFHITLSGRQPKSELPEIETFLQARLVPLLPTPITISDLALVGEDTLGRFHLISRQTFAG